MNKHHGVIAIAVLLGWATAAPAVTIEVDYSTDTANFFGTNPTAQAALEAAADLLSDLIITPLDATVDVNEATNNSATVTFDHFYSYIHPETGGDATVDSAVLPANVVRMFVGTRNLGGPLGKGGPAGAGYDASASFFDIDDVPAAVTAAAAASTANLLRGGGPVIGSLNGNLGGTGFTIEYGSARGSVAFDPSFDWHFDHTTDVPDEKVDFYSVALHELLHALGIGSSDTWDSQVTGNDWTGSNVAALVGSGVDLIDTGDFSHIAEGTVSTIIGTLIPQEAVMDPTLTNGERKLLTALDVAFLKDIGWQVVPEPASWVLALVAGGVLLAFVAARCPRRVASA
jgi:hypothetical protein